MIAESNHQAKTKAERYELQDSKKESKNQSTHINPHLTALKTLS